MPTISMPKFQMLEGEALSVLVKESSAVAGTIALTVLAWRSKLQIVQTVVSLRLLFQEILHSWSKIRLVYFCSCRGFAALQSGVNRERICRRLRVRFSAFSCACL